MPLLGGSTPQLPLLPLLPLSPSGPFRKCVTGITDYASLSDRIAAAMQLQRRFDVDMQYCILGII